ncbi:cupin domain-containing protein [bacterium]|nr:cupin domain-containing protein [bacterium]
MDNNDIVVITGGFDPLHSGHIDYINSAAELGRVFIGVNSDEWLTRKKGKAFLPLEERLNILNNIKKVMMVVPLDDSDGTAKDAIRQARKWFPKNKIIFANGGDRSQDNIPEMDYPDDNIEFVFGIGGENKKNSSSWILSEWKAPKTNRSWGYYRILHADGPGIKVKELTIDPGKSLSMQRHEKRSEYWFVAEGTAQVETSNSIIKVYQQDDIVKIPLNEWHKLSNPFDKPCKIIEIQYGELCDEADIERAAE